MTKPGIPADDVGSGPRKAPGVVRQGWDQSTKHAVCMDGLSLTVTDPRNALDKTKINDDLLLQWVGDGICQGLALPQVVVGSGSG